MDNRQVFFLSLVGAGGFLYWYKKKQADELAARALQQAKEVAGTLRIPRPDFIMTIPRTKDELDTIDAHLCECVKAVDVDTLQLPDDIVQQLQLCLAKKVYPDFPWPPAPGDHESAKQMWLLFEYRIRSLANTEDLVRLCSPKPLPTPPLIPVPQPGPKPTPAGLHLPAHT